MVCVYVCVWVHTHAHVCEVRDMPIVVAYDGEIGLLLILVCVCVHKLHMEPYKLPHYEEGGRKACLHIEAEWCLMFPDSASWSWGMRVRHTQVRHCKSHRDGFQDHLIWFIYSNLKNEVKFPLKVITFKNHVFDEIIPKHRLLIIPVCHIRYLFVQEHFQYSLSPLRGTVQCGFVHSPRFVIGLLSQLLCLGKILQLLANNSHPL